MNEYFYPKIINLSLPKCASTSIDRFLSPDVSSGHEVWHSGITDALVKYKHNRYPISSLLNYFDLKYIATELDVDTSTYNHFIFEDLLRLCIGSRFILVLRDPVSWSCSMLNMWGYFSRIVIYALGNPSSFDLSDLRNWISWINRYGALYADSLNSYSVYRSCQSGDICNLAPTFDRLLEFWISFHARIRSTLVVGSEQIMLFSIKDLDSLSCYLSNVLSLPPRVNQLMPIENKRLPVITSSPTNPLGVEFITSSMFHSLCSPHLLSEGASLYSDLLHMVV
jgi:hypothetical protein